MRATITGNLQALMRDARMIADCPEEVSLYGIQRFAERVERCLLTIGITPTVDPAIIEPVHDEPIGDEL